MLHTFKKYTNPENDGRRKLYPHQHEDIKLLYHELGSYRKVAKVYDVDKHTIRAVIDPEKHKAKIERRNKTAPHLRYYNRKKNTIAMRKYRAKKKLLNIDKKQYDRQI